MTDDEPGSRTVTTGGISVEKSFEDDRFPVPAVRFVIRSNREDRTEVRLTDSIPERIPMEHIGFHPDYESEHWTAYKNHRVKFERDIEPGEEITTVYGIRADGDIDPTSFLDDPSVALPDTEEPVVGFADDVEEMISETLDENGDRVVDDLLTGDRDLTEVDAVTDAGDPIDLPTEAEGSHRADAGLESDGIGSDRKSADADFEGGTNDSDDDWADVDPGVEIGLSSEPSSNADAAPASDAATDADPDSDAGADVGFDSDSDSDSETSDAIANEATMETDTAAGNDAEALAAGLAAELREGRVDDEVLDVLRREIGVTAPESMDVRLRHVQSRVDDLAAYTDALEAFIDEHGPRERLDELESEIADVRRDVNGLESEIGSTADDHATVEDRITEIEDDVEHMTTLRDQLMDVQSTIDALESRVDANAQDLDETDEDLNAIRSELSALSEDVAEVSSELDETVAPLATRLKQLEDDLDAFRDDVKSLQSWRDHVTDVFGGE